METITNIIAGRRQTGTSTQFFSVHNPATGKEIKRFQGASIADVNEAVASAKNAFTEWSQTTLGLRSALMYKYRELLLNHTDELVELIGLEHGKTLLDAKGELSRGIEIVEYACSISTHLKSEFSPNLSTGIDSFELQQPLGVCVGITPFNFPAMVPLWMFPIAVACGNTFVLKPAERNPSCALRLTELFLQAGHPAGVLNTLLGDEKTVNALLHHPEVRAISFVGSSRVAEIVYHTASDQHKRVQALGSAKNHLLALPDANVNSVVDATIGAAFGSAGERCMAISVLVCVGDDFADEVIASMIPKVEALKVGAYNEEKVDFGPLITDASKTRILRLIEAGIADGAKLMVDGRKLSQQSGYFLGGCLFDNVDPKMSIYQEEIFGPVLCVIRVQSYEEALTLINDNPYGNGASIFTLSGYYARHFSQNVCAGMVGVNVPIPVPSAGHSFGGWKRSLYGQSSIYGGEGVRFYTRLKTVTQRWETNIEKGARMHFKGDKEL